MGMYIRFGGTRNRIPNGVAAHQVRQPNHSYVSRKRAVSWRVSKVLSKGSELLGETARNGSTTASNGSVSSSKNTSIMASGEGESRENPICHNNLANFQDGVWRFSTIPKAFRELNSVVLKMVTVEESEANG